MRVSVVLLWFCLSCVQHQRGDDQLVVEDTQSGLNRLQNQSRVERSELNPNQPNVWAELRELRDMVVEQRVQLQFSQGQIEELKQENTAMNNRLLELTQVNSDRPKVAFSFSSGLNGHLGPFSVDAILVFSKEITNIGNAFSPITGVFTAPLRGVYYFRFNSLGNSASHWIGAFLIKNREEILYLSEFPNKKNAYVSNAVTLLLEKGDLAYVKLRGNCQVFDDSSIHSVFSGFLLFPM